MVTSDTDDDENVAPPTVTIGYEVDQQQLGAPSSRHSASGTSNISMVTSSSLHDYSDAVGLTSSSISATATAAVGIGVGAALVPGGQVMVPSPSSPSPIFTGNKGIYRSCSPLPSATNVGGSSSSSATTPLHSTGNSTIHSASCLGLNQGNIHNSSQQQQQQQYHHSHHHRSSLHQLHQTTQQQQQPQPPHHYSHSHLSHQHSHHHQHRSGSSSSHHSHHHQKQLQQQPSPPSTGAPSSSGSSGQVQMRKRRSTTVNDYYGYKSGRPVTLKFSPSPPNPLAPSKTLEIPVFSGRSASAPASTETEWPAKRSTWSPFIKQ